MPDGRQVAEFGLVPEGSGGGGSIRAEDYEAVRVQDFVQGVEVVLVDGLPLDAAVGGQGAGELEVGVAPLLGDGAPIFFRL